MQSLSDYTVLLSFSIKNMPIKFPCEICKRTVAENHKVVCCDVCNIWVHIKCNKINTQTYNLLKRETAAWSCIDCSKDFFPYSNLTDIELLSTMQGKKTKFLATRQKCRLQESVLADRLNNALNDSDLTHTTSSYYNMWLNGVKTGRLKLRDKYGAPLKLRLQTKIM